MSWLFRKFPSNTGSPAAMWHKAGYAHIWDTHAEMLNHCCLRDRYPQLVYRKCAVDRCRDAQKSDGKIVLKARLPHWPLRTGSWHMLDCSIHAIDLATIQLPSQKHQCFPDTSYREPAGAILDTILDVMAAGGTHNPNTPDWLRTSISPSSSLTRWRQREKNLLKNKNTNIGPEWRFWDWL